MVWAGGPSPSGNLGAVERGCRGLGQCGERSPAQFAVYFSSSQTLAGHQLLQPGFSVD